MCFGESLAIFSAHLPCIFQISLVTHQDGHNVHPSADAIKSLAPAYVINHQSSNGTTASCCGHYKLLVPTYSPEFLSEFRQPSGVPSPAPGGKKGICPLGSTRPDQINSEEIESSSLQSLDRISLTIEGFGGPYQPRDFLQPSDVAKLA
ncbi:hypothetical protein IEQ34_022037 [Dendrobium chrysotoxum]|uniref:Uncharacterized protein n=1 Tax=Dendrobium chrysotoxum TaxID=161865 RepID=A0AAV7FXX1_DENCH|nr:hypothetical protein IEQ34_022037 [Dendrobium chrysotoxum]